MKHPFTSSLLATACLCLLTVTPVFGDILFSDNFDEPDGTALPGKASDIGGDWTQTDGPGLIVTNGSIDTTGAARVAYCDLATPFDGSQRVLKLTVDFTLLSHNDGYAGISLFNGTQELIFLGDLNGASTSIGVEGSSQNLRAVAQPTTLNGVITLTYDFETGRTNLYAGADITAQPLATSGNTSFLTFDRIRIANNNGGDIGIGSIEIESLEEGPPTINLFTIDRQITKQGDNPILDWDTSFADQVTINPVPGEVDTSGSVGLELNPGDTEFSITATDLQTEASSQTKVITRSVMGGAMNYRYLRFNTIKTREPGSDFVQLAEMEFYDPTSKVTPVSITNPGGVNPVTAEGPASLIDGDPGTKWVDNAKAPLIFDFGTTNPGITDYSFVTAANLPEWDPVMWTMEGSNDGITWTLVENVTAFDFNMPWDRQTPAQFIPFPGASLIPLSFEILSMDLTMATHQIQLTWESSEGAIYQISSSTNLTDWTPIKSGISGMVGTTTSTAEFPLAPKQFFRVEQQ
ncbi:hypothetical protein JIN85_19130 [Luteolibacter pohnpeiensis]|uniref:F5/8 type C domain-containing protein n=1 Tax=Luteolibacter pohnpeiensis TaxID=454153 RepID=A0A934SG29_9BACT|nr:hypothetical protein [Luteolibacter pohnpeiensis]MBK1884538.1 hypothetical protein [Luteolibacter pohnpeiensis]